MDTCAEPMQRLSPQVASPVWAVAVGVDDRLPGRRGEYGTPKPRGAYSLGPSKLCPRPAFDFRQHERPSVPRSDLAVRARNEANPQIRHNAASNRCDLSSASAP